jgi:hypothetical protein
MYLGDWDGVQIGDFADEYMWFVLAIDSNYSIIFSYS